VEKIRSRNASSRRTSHTLLTPGAAGQLSNQEVGHFGGSAPTVRREGGGCGDREAVVPLFGGTKKELHSERIFSTQEATLLNVKILANGWEKRILIYL